MYILPKGHSSQTASAGVPPPTVMPTPSVRPKDPGYSPESRNVRPRLDINVPGPSQPVSQQSSETDNSEAVLVKLSRTTEWRRRKALEKQGTELVKKSRGFRRCNKCGKPFSADSGHSQYFGEKGKWIFCMEVDGPKYNMDKDLWLRECRIKNPKKQK